MKTTTQLMSDLEKYVAKTYRKFDNKYVSEKREQAVIKYCNKNNLKYYFSGKKPGGRAGYARYMKKSNIIRFYTGCGYGKYNYAPCIEVDIFKQQN